MDYCASGKMIDRTTARHLCRNHAEDSTLSPATFLAMLRVIDYREAQFEKVLREKVDVVFDLIGGDTQKRSFLVLKEGGHLVAATQPVSQEETARRRVSGAMMRLAPSARLLGRIARLLEEGTIRPDVATLYALQDAAPAWKDIARNL